MQKVINRLIIDHMRLERVLNCLDEQISRYILRSDDRPQISVMRDAMEYIRTYPDSHHHPLEDRILDELMDQVNNIRTLRNLQQIKSEHAILAEMTLRLAHGIDMISQDQVVPLSEIEQAFGNYYDLQTSHLNHENELFFPLIDNYFGDAQLQAYAIETGIMSDPLFDQRQTSFDELYASIVEAEEYA